MISVEIFNLLQNIFRLRINRFSIIFTDGMRVYVNRNINELRQK